MVKAMAAHVTDGALHLLLLTKGVGRAVPGVVDFVLGHLPYARNYQAADAFVEANRAQR